MLFKPDYVAPAAVFIAGVVVCSQQLKAKLPVQGGACVVRHGYDAVGCADALFSEQVQKRPVEFCAEAHSRCVLGDVDGKFCVPVIGCTLLRAVGVGVGEDFSVLLRNQPWINRAVAADASGEFRLGRQRGLKGDGRIDILCVNGETGRCIMLVCKPKLHFAASPTEPRCRSRGARCEFQPR